MGSLLIKVGQSLLSFLVVVVWVRVLGPQSYGVYSLALAILVLSAIPAQVGVPQLIVRETAKAQAENNWGLMRGLWRWGNTSVALFSIVSLAVVVGIVFWADFAENREQIETLIIGLVLIPLIALANVRGACLRGLRKVVLGQLAEGIIRPILLLGFVWIWINLIDSVSPIEAPMAMGLHLASVIAAFLVGAWLLQKFKPKELSARPSPVFEISRWSKAVLPLGLITGIQVINNQTDIVILGLYRPNEEVGIYKAVSQLAMIILFAFQAFNQVLQPFFSRMYAKKDMKRISYLIDKSIIMILIFSVPLVILYSLLGREILGVVFGELYTSGSLILIILSFGLIFKSLYGISATALNMTGDENFVFYIGALSVPINIVLNFLLIPAYGMEGASIATAITFILLGTVGVWIAKRKFSVRKSEN